MMMTGKWRACGALALTLAATLVLRAQDGTSAPAPQAPAAPKQDSHITPAQAKELFSSVDTILQFASDDSRLAIKSKVKRRLTTRNDVEKYLTEKMKDDKDAKRMERSE